VLGSRERKMEENGCTLTESISAFSPLKLQPVRKIFPQPNKKTMFSFEICIYTSK